MKARILALLAIMLFAATPAVIGLPAAASHAATHTNHSDHTPGVAQCTFTNPDSLPKQASANAVDALADRSSHCPPTQQATATAAANADTSQAAAQANHSDHPTGTAQCTFSHPTSLPKQASATAVDALADRSSHCPPIQPTA